MKSHEYSNWSYLNAQLICFPSIHTPQWSDSLQVRAQEPAIMGLCCTRFNYKRIWKYMHFATWLEELRSLTIELSSYFINNTFRHLLPERLQPGIYVERGGGNWKHLRSHRGSGIPLSCNQGRREIYQHKKWRPSLLTQCNPRQRGGNCENRVFSSHVLKWGFGFWGIYPPTEAEELPAWAGLQQHSPSCKWTDLFPKLDFPIHYVLQEVLGSRCSAQS